MTDNDTLTLPERLDRLRQWHGATSSPEAEQIIDRALIDYMLELIDDWPPRAVHTIDVRGRTFIASGLAIRVSPGVMLLL